MSVPGQNQKNYTHKVQYITGKRKYSKIIRVAFLIFFTIMLLCIHCQIKTNNRQVEHLQREIQDLRMLIYNSTYNKDVNHKKIAHNDCLESRQRDETIINLLNGLHDKINKFQRQVSPQNLQTPKVLKEIKEFLGKSQKFSQSFNRQFIQMKDYVFKLMQPMKNFLKKWF